MSLAPPGIPSLLRPTPGAGRANQPGLRAGRCPAMGVSRPGPPRSDGEQASDRSSGAPLSEALWLGLALALALPNSWSSGPLRRPILFLPRPFHLGFIPHSTPAPGGLWLVEPHLPNLQRTIHRHRLRAEGECYRELLEAGQKGAAAGRGWGLRPGSGVSRAS